MLRVGFVGLGNQGAPMAERIAAAGFPLTVYARRPEALEPFRSMPAEVAPSLRALGERTDLVGVCVVDDRQVEEVLLGDGILAGLHPGAVVAVHSTVHPDTCRRLGGVAAERGVTLLDAPVSGGHEPASRGDLTVMVGGDRDAFARCLPVFASFGSCVRHLGPLGSGQIAKLVNNLLFTINVLLAHEAAALGSGLGLERSGLLDVLQTASGGSFALRSYATRSGLAEMGRAVRLLSKDVGLLTEVSRTAGVDSALLRGLAERSLSLMAEAVHAAGSVATEP